MKYAIIGSGKIGTALARVFARKNIDFAIANSRGPETLASLRAELGPSVHPQFIEEACKADRMGDVRGWRSVLPVRELGRS